MALEDILKAYHEQEEAEKKKKEDARKLEQEKKENFLNAAKEALQNIILPKFNQLIEVFNKNHFHAFTGEGKPPSDRSTALTVEKDSHNMHLNVTIQPDTFKISFYFTFNTGAPSKQYNLLLHEVTGKRVEELIEQNFSQLLISMKTAN